MLQNTAHTNITNACISLAGGKYCIVCALHALWYNIICKLLERLTQISMSISATSVLKRFDSMARLCICDSPVRYFSDYALNTRRSILSFCMGVH